MSRPLRATPPSARRRRRATPGLESLEGRQLLAATTLASTVASGLPYAFFIDGSGTVSYQSDRLTNDPLNPTTPTGQIELPGLKAQSIAAYTGADGEPTVVALNGPESFVYANHYAPTGHDAQPLAWTGWQPLGSFVGTSITAANNAAGGPAIFAIGADHAVYENQERAAATPTSPAVRTGFDPIGGLYATAVKAQADGFGFAVFALDGPETFAYEADTTNYDGNSAPLGALRTTPWQSVDAFVGSAIDVSQGFGTAATNPGGFNDVVLFDLASNGVIFSDHLVKDANTGRRVGTGFHEVAETGNGQTLFTEFNVVVTPTVATLVTLTDNSPYPLYYQATTADQPDGWTSGRYLVMAQPTSVLAAVGLNGGPTVYGIDGPLYEDPTLGADAAGAVQFQNFSLLEAHPAYSLTTARGVAGLPAVFALGGDGSVYVDRDISSGAVGGPDVYSGFTRLAGIAATSIVATAEPQGMAVFALTGARTFVFENQYRPTGRAVDPYAWTGWSQVGTFTASSIAAVLPGDPKNPITPGGAVTGNPILMGIGATGLVYTLASTAPATSTDPYTFGPPSPLPDLLPLTITARATATGAEVFGLSGPESGAYADLYLPSGSGQAESQGWLGWRSLGNYVVRQVTAATGTGGVPALIGVDASSHLVINEYETVGGVAGWSGFEVIGDYFYLVAQTLATTYAADLGGMVFSVESSYNLWRTQFTSGSPPVETGSYMGSLGTTSATVSFATTPDFVNPAVYASEADGYIYVNQAIATGKPANPYIWKVAFTSLGPIPT